MIETRWLNCRDRAARVERRPRSTTIRQNRDDLQRTRSRHRSFAAQRVSFMCRRVIFRRLFRMLMARRLRRFSVERIHETGVSAQDMQQEGGDHKRGEDLHIRERENSTMLEPAPDCRYGFGISTATQTAGTLPVFSAQ